MASQAQLPTVCARIGPATRKPEPMIEASGVTVARHMGAASSLGRNNRQASNRATPISTPLLMLSIVSCHPPEFRGRILPFRGTARQVEFTHMAPAGPVLAFGALH